MEENNSLKEKMASAPRSPGVYLMKDAAQKSAGLARAPVFGQWLADRRAPPCAAPLARSSPDRVSAC